MNRNIRTQLLVVCVLANGWLVAVGQEAGGTQERAMQVSARATSAVSNRDQPSRAVALGRLPRYFSSIVDAQQRAAIYKIQVEFREKTALLERQLEELRSSEMSEIEKLLTAPQMKQLAELRAQVASRAAAKLESEPSSEAEGSSPPKKSENPQPGDQ